MILVDTNIFLECLLDGPHAKDCEETLEMLSKGEMQGVISRFTMHAIEAMYEDDLLPAFLRNIDASLGLYVYDTSTREEEDAATLAKRMKCDFDDAIQYYVASKSGSDAILSYDRHFDGLDIPRVEPKGERS